MLGFKTLLETPSRASQINSVPKVLWIILQIISTGSTSFMSNETFNFQLLKHHSSHQTNHNTISINSLSRSFWKSQQETHHLCDMTGNGEILIQNVNSGFPIAFKLSATLRLYVTTVLSSRCLKIKV